MRRKGEYHRKAVTKYSNSDWVRIARRTPSSLKPWQLFYFGQRRYGRAVQRGAVRCELRAVARTVPAALQRVPVNVTAGMRALR